MLCENTGDVSLLFNGDATDGVFLKVDRETNKTVDLMGEIENIE